MAFSAKLEALLEGRRARRRHQEEAEHQPNRVSHGRSPNRLSLLLDDYIMAAAQADSFTPGFESWVTPRVTLSWEWNEDRAEHGSILRISLLTGKPAI